LPRGAALRRLAATLDVEEGFILGLEPGDLIPPHMLEEAQGETRPCWHPTRTR
jgi:hypothetical protein